MVVKPTIPEAIPVPPEGATGIAPDNPYARPRYGPKQQNIATDILGNEIIRREPHLLETIKQDPNFVDIFHAAAGLTAISSIYRTFDSVDPEEMRALGYMPKADEDANWKANFPQIVKSDLEKLEDEARFYGYRELTGKDQAYLYNARTPEEYARNLRNIIHNRKVERTLAAAPASTIAAAMFMSLFEPQNWAALPLAGFGKISTARAVSKAMGYGAIIAGAEEFAFHAADPNRTRGDSAATMAFSAVIHAGIGGYLSKSARHQRGQLEQIEGYLSESEAIRKVVMNVNDYLPEGGATALDVSTITIESLLALKIHGLGKKRAEIFVRNIREMFEKTPMTADDLDAMSLAGLPQESKRLLKARLFVDDLLEFSEDASKIDSIFGSSHVLGKASGITSVLNNLLSSPFPEIRKLATEIFEVPYLTTNQVQYGRRAPVSLEQEIASARINNIEEYQTSLYSNYQSYIGRNVGEMGELGAGRTGVFFRGIAQAGKNVLRGENLNYSNITTPKGFLNIEEFEEKAVMLNRGAINKEDLGDAGEFAQNLSDDIDKFYSKHSKDVRELYEFIHGKGPLNRKAPLKIRERYWRSLFPGVFSLEGGRKLSIKYLKEEEAPSVKPSGVDEVDQIPQGRLDEFDELDSVDQAQGRTAEVEREVSAEQQAKIDKIESDIAEKLDFLRSGERTPPETARITPIISLLRRGKYGGGVRKGSGLEAQLNELDINSSDKRYRTLFHEDGDWFDVEELTQFLEDPKFADGAYADTLVGIDPVTGARDAIMNLINLESNGAGPYKPSSLRRVEKNIPEDAYELENYLDGIGVDFSIDDNAQVARKIYEDENPGSIPVRTPEVEEINLPEIPVEPRNAPPLNEPIQFVRIETSKNGDKTIFINKNALKKAFEEKSWKNPRAEGVDPVARNFEIYEDWEDFIVFRELMKHSFPPSWKKAGSKKKPSAEDLADYENKINRRASERMDEALAKSEDAWNEGNYLTRVWNRHQIEKNAPAFKAFLINQIIKKYGSNEEVAGVTGLTIPEWEKSIDKSIIGILSSPADRLLHEKIIDPDARLGTFDRIWNWIDDGDLYSTDFVVKNFSSIAHQYMTGAVADTKFFKQFGTLSVDEVESTLREKMLRHFKGRDLTNVEKDRIEKDLLNIRGSLERVRGIYMDKHSPLPGSLPQRILDSSMKFSNLRLASQFGIQSITDIGRPVIFLGLAKGLGPLFRSFSYGNAKTMEAMGAANRQLKALNVGNEINQQILISSMTNVNMNERTGTMLEKVISDSNNAMFMANGLSNWNQKIKRSVGIAVIDDIISGAFLLRAGKLPKERMDKLLKLHLDEKDLKIIANEFEKHGTSYKDIHLMNFENWDIDNDELLDLMNRLGAGVRKEVDTIIVTPGMGDAPLLMENSFVKNIGQYRAFQIAALNRVIIPMTQQGFHPDLFIGVLISAQIGQAVDQYNAFVSERPYDAGQWTDQLWTGLNDAAALGPFGMGIDYAINASEANPYILGPSITGLIDASRGLGALGGNGTPAQQRALQRSIPFATLLSNFIRPLEAIALEDGTTVEEAESYFFNNN